MPRQCNESLSDARGCHSDVSCVCVYRNLVVFVEVLESLPELLFFDSVANEADNEAADAGLEARGNRVLLHPIDAAPD